MNTEQSITLCGDDGVEHLCRVLGVFEFEEQEYALLLNVDQTGAMPPSESDPVLMRLVRQDTGTEFRMIESDEECARATAYVKQLVADLDAESSQGPDV